MLCGSYSVAKRWRVSGGRVFGIAAVQQKLTPGLPKIARRLGETPILTSLGNPRPYAIMLHSYRGPGAVLAPSWLRLGPILAPSWDHLRAILGHLGPSWAHLGSSWAVLSRLRATLGPLGERIRDGIADFAKLAPRLHETPTLGSP